MKKVEIICINCNQDTLLKREPIYNGLKKTADLLLCASCNYRYQKEEDVPFKEIKKNIKIFNEDDKDKKIKIFNDGENQKLCRYCISYVVNPFTQFCSIHKKEVQATDNCEQFESNNIPSKDFIF